MATNLYLLGDALTKSVGRATLLTNTLLTSQHYVGVNKFYTTHHELLKLNRHARNNLEDTDVLFHTFHAMIDKWGKLLYWSLHIHKEQPLWAGTLLHELQKSKRARILSGMRRDDYHSSLLNSDDEWSLYVGAINHVKTIRNDDDQINIFIERLSKSTDRNMRTNALHLKVKQLIINACISPEPIDDVDSFVSEMECIIKLINKCEPSKYVQEDLHYLMHRLYDERYIPQHEENLENMRRYGEGSFINGCIAEKHYYQSMDLANPCRELYHRKTYYNLIISHHIRACQLGYFHPSYKIAEFYYSECEYDLAIKYYKLWLFNVELESDNDLDNMKVNDSLVKLRSIYKETECSEKFVIVDTLHKAINVDYEDNIKNTLGLIKDGARIYSHELPWYQILIHDML